LSKYDNCREKKSPNLVTLSHIFHKNPLYESYWISFFCCEEVAKIYKRKKRMVKSLFFKSKKTENVANLTASLAVVDLGRGRGQRQIYVCVARHAFIYFNGQSEPGPTGTPRKTDGTWIANTFSVVLVPRPNHGV